MKYLKSLCLFYCVISNCICFAQTESGLPGGEGDAFPYIIRGSSQNMRPFDASRDYFAIDVISWYVNKQGNWRQSELATGTAKVTANGTDFEFPIGSFTLSRGAKTAPVFSIPLIPTTPYDGSPITLQANLVGMKKNTILGSVLQDIADTAVSYGSIALKTLSLAGAYPGLEEVSASATKTANSLVQQLGEKKVAIFDLTSGIKLSLQPSDLKGDVFHVLLHRGRRLDRAHLSISDDTISVLENGKQLEDGAWVLFRVRKESVYAGPRPWSEAGRAAINKLKLQIGQYKDDPDLGESLTKALRTTELGTSDTLGDRFVFVSNLIQSDRAISNEQMMKEATRLNSYLSLARKAIASTNANIFLDGVALLEGTAPQTNAVAANVKEAIQLAATELKSASGTNFINLSVNPELVAGVIQLESQKQLQLFRETYSYAVFETMMGRNAAERAALLRETDGILDAKTFEILRAERSDDVKDALFLQPLLDRQIKQHIRPS